MRLTIASAALALSVTVADAHQKISLRLGSGHPVQAVEYNIAATQYLVPELIRRAKENKISHRTSAMSIGVERVMNAKNIRGLFP